MTEQTFALPEGLLDVPLEHAGVKGMKWGVRRPVGKDGRVVRSGPAAPAKKAAPAKQAAPAKNAATAKPASSAKSASQTKPKPLTDEQLRQLVQRMQLEAQYAQLGRQLNPPQKSFLREYLSEPASAAAKDVSRELFKELIKTGVNAAVKRVGKK